MFSHPSQPRWQSSSPSPKWSSPPPPTPQSPATTGPRPRSEPPPFHPPRPSLPFIPFNLGSTPSSSSFSGPVFASGFDSAPSIPWSFEDEAPLLEELGINTGQIWRKTSSILNPFRLNPNLHEDADLAGPFLFLMAFGLFQLLTGKFQFGIILRWVIFAALFLYAVFNLLAGKKGSLDLHRCLSLVGYCMLPMVIFSAVSLFVPHGGMAIFAMAATFVLWSTRVCTGLLVELAHGADEYRGLIAYPCCLVYMLFSLLVMF
ncbi:hypothetical protein Cni_G13349 [Canna indica]|uniref:Protein YIP n=1 Tax=Canna indica TaxID=4628 RepID=A0AAQ3K9P1_9LILI|nr:hypothetical protein Cni_G13349 [Canna indica]